MDTEKLEEKVKEIGGESGNEIIDAVRELAKVDVEIKNALDEIERIAEDLPARHNELADKINDLVRKVCEKNEEPAEEHGKHEKDSEPPRRTVKVEVNVVPVRAMVPVPRMPLALMALLDFLNS